MTRLAPCLCFALALLGASFPACAKNWAVDYARSRLGFIGTQGSAAFEGAFGKFTAEIDFDPVHPETGRIAAVIDTASAKAGSAERDDALPQADWFDTAQFPEARFVSTAIRKTGEHAYEANGILTIKGIEKPVALPFTLGTEGNHWRAQGRVTLIRTDFGIGKGQWADEKMVKAAVEVTIDIAAAPQP